MITKILFFLFIFYCNTREILTQQDEALNERSWFWSVGKMKGQTWRWEQDGGYWTAWKWTMRGRQGAGFFFAKDSNIGPYIEANIDSKQKNLRWTWLPASKKTAQLSAACKEGVFNYTGKSGLFSLDLDDHTLRNVRVVKASSNICNLKTGEKEGKTPQKSADWTIDGRKSCESVLSSDNADTNDFLIYVVLAQHPSTIPSVGDRTSRGANRSKRQAEGEETTAAPAAGGGGETEWVTTPAPPTTTEEDEDYDDDAPEPSFFDTIMEMIISFFGKVISFFM